MVRPI